MQNQIQCPVCTLYLHVGMNLQIHLETHPKDQVISALVNLTLLQQNTNENDDEVAEFRCSTYSPLTQENVPQTTPITSTDPILPKQRAIEYHSNELTAPATTCNAIEKQQQQQQPAVPPQESMTLTKNTQQQVMIVNSCSTTRVIRNDVTPQKQAILSSQILNNALPPVGKDSQTTTTTNTNVSTKLAPIIFTAQQILPPPPPYDINNSTYKRIFHQGQFTEHSKSSSSESYLNTTPIASSSSTVSTHNIFLLNDSIRNIANITDLTTGSSLQQSNVHDTNELNVTEDNHENDNDNHDDDDECNYEIISPNNKDSNEKHIEHIDDEENQQENVEEIEQTFEEKSNLPLDEDDVIIIDEDPPVNVHKENNYLDVSAIKPCGVIHLNDSLPSQHTTTNEKMSTHEHEIIVSSKKRSRTGLRIISNVKLDASNAIPISKTIFCNSSFSGTIIDVDSYKPKLKMKQSSSLLLPNIDTQNILKCNELKIKDVITLSDDEAPGTSNASIITTAPPKESRHILFDENVDQLALAKQSSDDIVMKSEPVLNENKNVISTEKSTEDLNSDAVPFETNCSTNKDTNVEKPKSPAVHVPVISIQTSVIRMASMHIAETRPITPKMQFIETEIETNLSNLPPPPPYSEAVSQQQLQQQQQQQDHAKTIVNDLSQKSFDFNAIQSTESSSSRTLLKKPFVRAPKKLVVKFKKPFIPVVDEEEDANLQAPTNLIISAVTTIQPKIEPTDLSCMENEISNEHHDHGESKMLNSFDDWEKVPFSPLRDTYTPAIPYYIQKDEPKNQQNIDTEQEIFPEEYLPSKLQLKTEPINNETNVMEIDDLEHTTSINNADDDNLQEEAEEEEEGKQNVAIADADFNQSSDENLFNANQLSNLVNDEVNNDDDSNTVVNQSPDCSNGGSFIVENEMPLPMSAIIEMKKESWTDQDPATINNTTLLNIDTKKEIEVTNITSGGEIFTILTANEQYHHPQTIAAASTSKTMQNNYTDTAGPSRLEYGLSTFLGYNDPADGEDFYSGVPLSPIGFSPDNYVWNQRFSPPFAPFDNNERNSYMDLDMCKNTNSNYERAASVDSLNIRTDEKMPAKGEISEQESNGDIDGSWSHQIFPLQDTLPRYTSSYDTTVARESWSLSNDQNLLQQNIDHLSTILPKFTPLHSSMQPLDIKPNVKELAKNLHKSTKLPKSRKYRCPVCPKIFSGLKEKRSHLISEHDSQYLPKIRRSKVSCTTTSAGTSNASMVTSEISLPELPDSFCGSSSGDALLLRQRSGHREHIANMNRYLLNYNWTVLRQKLALEVKTEDVKIVIYPTESNVFMCLVCHERFNSIKALSAHFIVHPAECYTCGRTFKNWLNFSVHMKRHLNIREYSCLHCTKKFVLRQNLLEHMNTHSGDTPFQCKFCPKRFRRYSNLVQHRNRHHLKIRPKEKDYICVCGEVFHSAAKIAWHKETHDVKPKCCPYCRERFMHKNSLSRHIRLSHTEQFPLFKTEMVDCPICNQKYMKSSLKTHLAVHSVETPYECTICNKSFTTKWNLKQHKWIHASRSSKPFKCSMCTKAFIREAEYISHVNAHKSIKPYTCDHCGCQFARKYNWLRHTREHEVPKKYRCDDCGKVFHRAYYLTEHRRSHTGERPFECIICGKTSTTKTNHNKHVKIHHARDPLTAEG